MTNDPKNLLKKAKINFQEKKYKQVDSLLIDVLSIDHFSTDAWRLYVETEFAQKNWNNAFYRVKEALESKPDEPIFYIFKAKIEKNLGKKDAAILCLNHALVRWPTHRGIQSEILSIWQSQGERLAAFPLLHSLKSQLTELPVHLLMASARFFLSHKRFQVADALVKLVLYKQPGHENASKLLHDIPVEASQDALQRRSLEYAEIKIAESIALEKPLDITWRISAQIAYERKDFITAMKRLQIALETEKDRPALRHLQFKILRGSGDDTQALKVIDAGLHRWPDQPALQCAQLDLLRESGRASEAFLTLRTIQRQEDSHPSAVLAAARFYVFFNRYYAAINLLERLLKYHPKHMAGRLLYWTVLAKKSEVQFIDAVKSTWDMSFSQNEWQRTEVKELHHIVILLSRADLVNTQELNGLYVSMMNCLIESNMFLSERESYEILEIADARDEKLLVKRIMQYLFDAGPTSAFVAKRLFSKTINTVPDNQVNAFVERLLRFLPSEDRQECMAAISLRLQGPKAALNSLLQIKRTKRTLKQALQILDYLRLADVHGLTLRYIRFCRRRWNDSQDLALLQVKTFLDAGYPSEALAIIDEVSSRHKRIAVSNLRARCLLHLGRVEEAQSVLETGMIAKSNYLLMTRLHTFIMAGHESKAKEIIENIHRQEKKSEIVSDHFSVSLLGSLINDLSLYRQEIAYSGEGFDKKELILRHTYPATQSILAHLDSYREVLSGNNYIPRNIVQYWNTVKVPASIQAIMRTWHDIPETHYRAFNKIQARRFLRKEFGKLYEKAFLLANSPAEEADFFRLCFLAKCGGIYADADDGYHHGFEELFPSGVELVCFREEYGALANNVIVAAPGHPAIEYAVKMAAQSLLAKDNENTWHKTGPGLLSRAVAFFLSKATSKEVDKVSILPQLYLRRRVHIHMDVPHKKTSNYWNAKDKKNWSYKCLSEL